MIDRQYKTLGIQWTDTCLSPQEERVLVPDEEVHSLQKKKKENLLVNCLSFISNLI